MAGQVDGRAEPLLENQSMPLLNRHLAFRETASAFSRALQ